MDLILTPIGLIGLFLSIILYFLNSRRTLLGGASLPCMMILTSLIYFYLMPFLSLIIGGGLSKGMFGIVIYDLRSTYLAVILYTLGAVIACTMGHKTLVTNPAQFRVNEKQTRPIIFLILFSICILMALVSVLTGRVNIFASENFQFATDENNLRFVNLFFTSLISLTTVYTIKKKFGPSSIILILIVMFVFLQIGFRYRVILLIFALFVSYMLINRKKIHTGLMVLGCFVGLALVNIIRGARRYGNGLDLSRVADWDSRTAFTTFGGEIGPIYVMNNITSNPLPNLVYFEPWLVGIARLIPSAIWPNKPKAGYLEYFHQGFTAENADRAGIAAPQHVEMLVQFGWIGLPILSCLYFLLIIFLLSRISKLSRETRIAGFALVPIFFGFYMQTRGYFFQTLSDGLFLFGPLFLLNWKARIISPQSRLKPQPIIYDSLKR